MSIKARLSRIEKYININDDIRANHYHNDDGSLRVFWMYEVTAEYFDHVVRNDYAIMQHCCREIDPEIRDRVVQNPIEKALPEDRKEQIRKSTLQDWYVLFFYEILKHPHKIAFNFADFGLEKYTYEVINIGHIEYIA